MGRRLALLADGRVTDRGAVADGDDEILAHEQVGFAEPHFIVHELGRLDDDEQRVRVGLQLGPLVGVQRVLDGKLVEGELLLHLPQQRGIRLVHAQPDEGLRFLQDLADVVDGNVAEALAAAIGDTIDDHRLQSRQE